MNYIYANKICFKENEIKIMQFKYAIQIRICNRDTQ